MLKLCLSALTVSLLLFSSCQSGAKESGNATTATDSAATTPAKTTEAAAADSAAAPAATADTTQASAEPLSPLDSLAMIGPKITGNILPAKRILAYYGNPHSKKMGILGEYPKADMLRRLDEEARNWEKADSLPIQKALHLVATSAQGSPGKDGKYRMRMSDKTILKVIRWAAEHNAICFLDIQVGLADLKPELEHMEKFLKLPYVHLGIDPEFSMKTGARPGSKIGTYDADDINTATQFLDRIVKENKLPPKILVVHRFTQRMVTNYKNIRLNPNVQIVMNMDGWGPPVLKKDTYRAYIQKEPVQFTGFKLFYHNDIKRPPHKLMTPAEVLVVTPKPVYIQYQ